MVDAVRERGPVPSVAGVERAEAVTEGLRAAIHRGELLPGDRLPPERELARHFGVGRSTLRRALGVLQQEGYLTARRGAGGGTFVTSLERPADRWLERMRADVDDLDDLYEYRLAVETHAARLAARKRTDEHLAAMGLAVSGLDGGISRVRFRQLDSQFHLAVAEAAGSRRLTEAVAACRAELFARTDRLEFDELVTQMREEHEAVLAAVAAADEERAAAAMGVHLRCAWAVLHQILEGGA